MKKLLLLFPIAACTLLIGVTSCGNSTSEEHADTHEAHAPHMSVVHPEGTDPKNIDPICDMVRDETWTDYMVYNNDSVWFCSEYCKDAFAANPEKYRN